MTPLDDCDDQAGDDRAGGDRAGGDRAGGDQAGGDRVGVVGGGTMGVGIAYVFAMAGWATTVVEPSADREIEMSAMIAAAARQGVERAKLSQRDAERVVASIGCVRSIGELDTGLGLIVETVPERLDVKTAVLAEIEARTPQMIATNTSALSIDRLAIELRDPSVFLGMHFFNPVWSLPMVELVRGRHTADATVERARHIAQAIGKQTITVTDSPGFATSRLDLIAALEAMRMFEDEVASADDIDRAMVIAYRHPMGPLRLSDIVGLDVRLDIAEHLADALGPRYAAPQVLRDKVAAGELGRKTGRGFFDWADDPPAVAVPSQPRSSQPRTSQPRTSMQGRT